VRSEHSQIYKYLYSIIWLMSPKEMIWFKAFVTDEIRNFFKNKHIPEVRYGQFSFAGSCENAPTTYWIDKTNDFLMLPQTRQIMAEEDLIRNDLEAVFIMQTSYRDEPKAGDGRHCRQFLLCELEQKNLSQPALVDLEEEMIRYLIQKALDYFAKYPDITTNQNVARLKYWAAIEKYPRISYTDIINKLHERGVSINWGDDFSSTEEQFICAMFYDIPVPVAVTDFPEKLKYFNMYERRDTIGQPNSTVECCDFLLPYAGETFGSSRREVDGMRIRYRFYNGSMYKQLKERLVSRPDVLTTEKADEIIHKAFEPYFKLFDTEVHDRAGFGMGVGRLAQFLLGSTTVIEI